jgi:hypothetical protein
MNTTTNTRDGQPPSAAQGPAGASGPLPFASGDTSRPGDDAPAGAPGTGEGVCRRCGGSGRLGATGCPECSGTGRVTTAIGGG